MKFIIKISMNGQAFLDNPNGTEIARALKLLSEKLEGEYLNEDDKFPLHDTNGNKIGTAIVEYE